MPAAAPTTNPLAETTRWLATHAGFPARRLEPWAERLVCLAALAGAQSPAAQPRFAHGRRDTPHAVAQRAHALRRAHAHDVCDNRTAV